MDNLIKFLEKFYLPFEHWMSAHVDLSHCFHYIIANILTAILLDCNINIILVLFIMLIIAIGKEVFDYKRYGKFDVKDIIATMSGTITPIIPILF